MLSTNDLKLVNITNNAKYRETLKTERGREEEGEAERERGREGERERGSLRGREGA